jgi:hypothetical protein
LKLAADRVFWRVHGTARDPRWFGPAPGEAPGNRFDAPGGEYRVCYLGDSPEVAFAETFLRGPGTRLLERAKLSARSFSSVPLSGELTLARLHGPGLVRLGIGAEIVHGHPYATCQNLALDLWSHRDRVDGIAYRSRWDNDRLAVALFDRAEDAFNTPDLTVRVDEFHRLPQILQLYGVGVI